MVATEVGNLASRSAKAAKESAAMIENSLDRVEAGAEISKKTSQFFSDITESVESVAELVGEISEANNSQKDSVKMISESAVQMSNATFSFNEQSERMAQRAKTVSASSVALNDNIAGFKFSDPGGPASGATHRPAAPDHLKLVSARRASDQFGFGDGTGSKPRLLNG